MVIYSVFVRQYAHILCVSSNIWSYLMFTYNSMVIFCVYDDSTENLLPFPTAKRCPWLLLGYSTHWRVQFQKCKALILISCSSLGIIIACFSMLHRHSTDIRAGTGSNYWFIKHYAVSRYPAWKTYTNAVFWTVEFV